MPIHHANVEPSYRRTYKPETYHIAQEIQKYNIPDYRPRQEQYAASISSTEAALTCFPPQIPEGDQEGACGAAHAAEPRVRLQPDGERVAARPGAADTSLRHLQSGRAPDGVLNACEWSDLQKSEVGDRRLGGRTGPGRCLCTVESTSRLVYHYTDMYSTVALRFRLLIVLRRVRSPGCVFLCGVGSGRSLFVDVAMFGPYTGSNG